MSIKPQTIEFVNRTEALASFEQLLMGGAKVALAFQAPDGLGKSFLLREMRLLSESNRVRVVLVEAAREFAPDHWHIIRRMVERWPESMQQSAATLQRLESFRGPVERLPDGGILITGGTFTATGDLVIGQKLVLESDAQDREYRGLQIQVDQAFFADLAQMCRTPSPALEPGKAVANAPPRQGNLLLLLFDNVDLATEETRNWLAQILRRMWMGDLPGLCLAVTGQSLPQQLATAAADCMDRLTLEPLKLEHVLQYCERIGLPPDKAADAFLFSQGNPALLKVIASNALRALKR